MTEMLGMHWTIALFLISIIMLVTDLFIFQGEVLTFISDVFFTLIVLHFVPTENWIWLAFWGIFIYALVLAVHWFGYRKFALYLVDKFLVPQKRKSNNDILIGKIGTICWIEEQSYIRIEDEYIPCVLVNGVLTQDNTNAKAKVLSWNDSKELTVSLVN